jgi:hypothetical protein
MIKIMVLLSTLIVGFFYTRRELKALVDIVREKDYVSWYDLNKAVAKRETSLY